MANTIEWAKLLSNIYNGTKATCPECGGKICGNIYSNDGKIGFAILECENCKKYVKLSRINIPKGVKTSRF